MREDLRACMDYDCIRTCLVILETGCGELDQARKVLLTPIDRQDVCSVFCEGERTHMAMEEWERVGARNAGLE